jgi:phosphoribosylformylglycinamidine synthase
VGIQPQIGRIDPYAMALAVVEEAVRNLVAVGADPDRIAILDNFCWGNPTYPDRLGSLVRACQGCYDAALAYRAPFISGKDSLFNEYNGSPIPPTLLISAIAIVPDMEHTATSDFKEAGNAIYLVGESHAELGGSLLYHLQGRQGGAPPAMPSDPLPRYRALHRAIGAGLVQAAHDLSEGGLAVALAEMCLGGRLGAQVELAPLLNGSLTAEGALFGESNGRLLVEVADADAPAFEAALAGTALTRLGAVSAVQRLSITLAGAPAVELGIEQLLSAWKGDAA